MSPRARGHRLANLLVRPHPRLMPRTISRRRLLAGLGLAVTYTALGRPTGAQPIRLLRAKAGSSSLLGTKTAIWTYDGTAAGPTLRLGRGEGTTVRLVND